MSTTGIPHRIPFHDLLRQHREVEDEVAPALARVLGSGHYILGREVESFEDEWARWCGASGAVGVGNGTDALALSLIASGAVRPGHNDEVITSPLSAAYTALAIRNAGGVPVFADIHPQTYTIEPDSVARAITSRTRAIVPVHLYGQMADMPAINEVAERRGLIVIEDAAQAHGAVLNGRAAGTHGHAAAFSFYPTKNLGAYGDAGAVVSNDAELIERVKSLRQGGSSLAVRSEVAGRNSRLDELQAAVLRVKLKFLPRWNERRRQLAQMYHTGLRDTPLKLPFLHEAHCYHLFVVEHPERDRIRACLIEKGIETLIHYSVLLPEEPLFRRSEQSALPIAETVVRGIFSLPLYPQLRDDEAVAVIEGLTSALT
ncbi:MAG: DegT/DnrJ/EryC1/StrS family aminotransferase [Acidobacteriota bacterium]